MMINGNVQTDIIIIINQYWYMCIIMYCCRSWQVIQFDPLPVTFVKIVGTKNTANEVHSHMHS